MVTNADAAYLFGSAAAGEDALSLSVAQPQRRPWSSWRAVRPVRDDSGLDERALEVRNVLEEASGETESHVVEEDEVLMQLPHVAHVRDHLDVKATGHQTDN